MIKRVMLLVAVAAVMAAMMVAMAMPAFAAANPERAAEQARITSNWTPGTLGQFTGPYCSSHQDPSTYSCGEEVSNRDSNPQN